VSPLDKKLLRDLARIKGQALAIGLVMAVGVLMLVMMKGLVTSLDETRRAYYERYRLADVFAPVTRASDRVLDRLAAIPGVSAVEARVTGSALIDLPGYQLPLQAKAVSLPDFGSPRLNDIYLTDGRLLDSNRTDEVLLLNSFARVHDLRPGDRLSATMNGARRTFSIVGLAQSPEFLYTTAPGELAPDDSRFGVLWMSRAALASAYDMRGAFNQALLALGRGANTQATIARVDRVLKPFGGLGSYGLADHASNRFVSEEIDGLRGASAGVPPIFLGVASFLLYIVITRIVQMEREQIGLMKAFGYSALEICGHYLKLVLIVAAGGAMTGCLMGVGAGRALVEIYLEYYKFPFLVFEVDTASMVTGVSVSIASASTGGLIALRTIFALSPAVAMRPPAPADYSRVGAWGPTLNRVLDQPTRMVLRGLMREPGRLIGSVVGIGAGMGLSVGMMSILGGFEQSLDQTFTVIDRSDVTVTFTQVKSDKTIFELKQLGGVIEVEPVRHVSAVLRSGLRSHRGVVTGLVAAPRLNRVVAKGGADVPVRAEGIIIATALAQKLALSPGDTLEVEVRDGRQPTLTVPVVGIADTLLGAPAFMSLDGLNRALREPNRVSGAYLRIDSGRTDEIFLTLKNMPSVAGVSRKADARQAFEKMMDSGAGAMRYVMAGIAFVITFGIVYNAARIAQAERGRDLATLRVIGFTQNEVAFVLLGELAVVTLIALPLGSTLGYYLSFGIAAGFSSDLYQIPVVFSPASYGIAALAVIGAVVISGILVNRDIGRTDLVAALKIRE
jgi:putative ABC transport system permease protein